ncbi:MAG: hypothetical protein AAF628_05930 [Planctomycetota bacterium]
MTTPPDAEPAGGALAWTDLAAPTEAEVARVCAELGVPPEFAAGPNGRGLRRGARSR